MKKWMKIFGLWITCLLCLLATATTANATTTANVNISWGASSGFYFSANTSAGILGPVGSGKSTVAQLMYSPDAIKDGILTNRAGVVNDVVWDTVTLTENSTNELSDWAIVSSRNYENTFTNGYVYALIFQDNNVQPGDWYFSTPLMALEEITPAPSVFPQNIEMNTDFVNGDPIDGANGAQVAGVLLTVIGGSGSGSYTNGQQVEIAASQWLNRTFIAWIGDTQYVSSATASNTTVTLPALTNSVSVILTATYNDVRLTVNNGIGGGTYTNGQQVAIGASTAPTNQMFDRWTGDTQVAASVTSVTTIVTMPAQDVSLTATYKNIPNLYTLTVNRGTGSGSYTNGAHVPIIASNAPTGQAFDRWTGHTAQLVYSVTSPSNTVIMPTNAVSLTATYTNLPGWNTLTVNNGTGSGAYTNGTQVEISADATNGKVFYRWTGAIQYLAHADASPTVVTMPAWAITLSVSNRSDTNLPTVKIASPNPKAKILATNGQFTIRGTAADNKVVTDVLVTFNGDEYEAEMTDGKNWSLPVELIPGTNTILAYSVDSAFNSSLVSTVTCTYAETTIFTIQTNGLGKVELSPKGPAEIGKTYTLTASPANGSAFVDWTGDMPTTNRRIMFTMVPDKTAIANFIDIQKPTVEITYPATKKPQRIMTNGTVVLRGTAADNDGVDRVMYQLPAGAWTNAVPANGWKNWTADFSPVTGLNTARVYSVDVNGFISPTSTVVFTYAPGAVMTVQTNGAGTIKPDYNGKVLEIGKSYKMTAKAVKNSSVFTDWTYSLGADIVTNKTAITFVMQSNLVLTANFSSLLTRRAALVDMAVATPSTTQAAIVVDGASKDWTGVPQSSFSYASVTQEVAVALDGNNIALLLNGCPFETSDNVLVYFKLRLSYGDGDNRHSVDLWTSGAVLYGMVDGQVIAGLEAVLLNGVLEVKLPVEQAPSQVTIEEIGCGMDLGAGTLTELFKISPAMQ